MVKLNILLFYCLLISCGTARGVPVSRADDHEITLEEREKEISSDEYSDLRNCKDCTKKQQAEENVLSKDDNVNNNGKSTSDKKPPTFIKPSLSFKGIRIRVNDHRRHDAETAIFRNFQKHRTIYGQSSKEPKLADGKQTLAPNSNANIDSHPTETYLQSNLKVKDTDIKHASENNDGKNDNGKINDNKTVFSSKSSTSLPKVEHLSKQEDTLNKADDNQNVKFSGLEKVVEKSLKSEVDNKKKDFSGAEDEQFKNEGKNTDSKFSKGTKPKTKTGDDEIKETRTDESKEDVYVDDDGIVFGKETIGRNQRWPGDDLNHVPDADRLEWKLHPSVDIPVRDILHSLKNMLSYLQQGIQYVHKDYDAISNTTRWNYMMGVRDGLTTLAEENDIIYSVVLETSLLTKEIFRKAHERRHPKPTLDVQPIVADYRQRYRYNIGMELQDEETRVISEIEKAKRLVDKMKHRLDQRESFKEEVRKMAHLVNNGFSLSALHDLERRARQTMNVLTSSAQFRSITDRANLYTYAGENIHSTLKEAKDLLSDSYDVITTAKQIVMTNQEKVHQYEMLIQNAFRPEGMIDKIERVVAKDRATLHAQDLSHTAAVIMTTLKPLIQKASELLSPGSKYSFEKRLTNSADELQELVNKLRMVYDKIIIEIDDERVFEERCETEEGSGWFNDDDDYDNDDNSVVMIDCTPYTKVVESSGDDSDLEGSGDIDNGIELTFPGNDGDISIDKTDDVSDEDNEDIDIEEIDMTTNTDDIIYIDENDENLQVSPREAIRGESMKESTSSKTSTSSPKTTSNTESSSTKTITNISSSTSAVADITLSSKTTETPSLAEAKSTQPSTTKTPPTTTSSTTATTTTATTRVTTAKPFTANLTPETSTATTKPSTTTITTSPTATTTTPKPSTTEATIPTTIKTTTKKSEKYWLFGGWFNGGEEKTTTTTTSTTTETMEESKEAVIVSNWFGEWSNDEPISDNINFGFENSLEIHDHLLNTLIRQRLANYSKESKAVMSQAKVMDELSNELSLTWLKVEKRFQNFENSSLRVSTFVNKWKAKKALFHAIHDRVVEINDETVSKNNLVNTQCEAVIEKVNKKVESKEKQLEAKRKRGKTSADQEEYDIAKKKVSLVTKNVEEIKRLKQLYPNPCSVLEKVDNAIKTNITELRKKIAKAKLLTSSLKLSIGVQKDSEPMVYSIPSDQRIDNPLRDNVRVMLRHTGSDGQVLSMKADDEEIISLEVQDDSLLIIQTIDGEDEMHTVNITDQQYLLDIKRFGNMYNFTFSTKDNKHINVNTGSLFDASSSFNDDNVPTSLHIGGSEELSMCFLGLQVNGRHVDWFNKQNNDNTVLPTVCESQSRWLTFDSHLLFDGSGFAMYDLPVKMKSFTLSFNPRSPGTIFVLHDKRKRILIDGYIDDNGLLTVYLKYDSFVKQMNVQITYGLEYTIKLIFMSGNVREIVVTLNDKADAFNVVNSEMRTLIKEENIGDNIYIGGLPNNNSTFVGCIKEMYIDNKNILFETFKEAENIKFGECQLKNCFVYSNESSSIEMKSVPDITTLYIVVKKGSSGPVLQFSKSREKFSLTISVTTDGVDIKEKVKDESESIDTEDEYITIKILEDAKDQSVKVTINDDTEEFDYAEYEKGWFGIGRSKKEDLYTNYTYDINIGGSTDNDKPFIGSITDVIINGSPFNMIPYIEVNKLSGCQAIPTVKEYKRPKMYQTMTCS